MRSRAADQGALGSLVRCLRTPGEAEGLFLWEMVADCAPPAPALHSLLGIQASWSGLTLWAMGGTSGALAPFCLCLAMRVSGKPQTGSCSSWKMRSYLREAGTRITCCALLKYVSLGRADAWQPPRLMPKEMGIVVVAAGRRPACVCPFPLALANDQPRPRSFKLGGRQGKPDLVEKAVERGLVGAKQRRKRMSVAARGIEVR